MPIEIEKKYRLSKQQREEILRRLPEIGAKRMAKSLKRIRFLRAKRWSLGVLFYACAGLANAPY